MNTVFLCYETNPKTGLSEVKEVNTNPNFAKNFMYAPTPTTRRVEEWDIMKHEFEGHYSIKVKDFFSVDDFN